MISYERAKKVLEILNKNISHDCDTVNWIKFYDDESEEVNAAPEPSEVEHICVKYFIKLGAGAGSSAYIAIVDIDATSIPCFSLQINDFTEWRVGKILTNLESAHNCIKYGTIRPLQEESNRDEKGVKK